MSKRLSYKTFPTLPDTVRTELDSYSPLMQQLLYNRGITKGDTADLFLNPDYETMQHDPFLLTDMERAVARTLKAIESNEHIVIYSDYDCDGIPGGVLLHDFFTEIGYQNFENFIPHRHHDGYGLSPESIPKLKANGASLIITVDCGITDHEAVEAARGLGVDVIVTDHHEPGDTLPDAYAVINPKRDDAYPFSGICGTAVAYKLVLAILKKGREEGRIALNEGKEKWWLDLVGLATVADMVPLTDENRVYAHFGLRVLRKSRRPGLQHLLQKAGASQKFLTEDDIGFTIAPRINAASRMDDPEDAFHMLSTRDEEDAGQYVAHLEKLNNERRGVVASMTKEAKKKLSVMKDIPKVIVLGNPLWRPSLVGLVANTLAETHKRPAFLWGRDGKGVIKGSCRSDGTISVVKLMEKAKDALLTFGGHHASGGFSVHDDHIHTLPEILSELFESLHDEIRDGNEEPLIDAHLTLERLDESLLRDLVALSPFGLGNHKPLFAIEVIPDEVEIFGKAQNHTKIRIKTSHSRYEAIAFFKLPQDFTIQPESLKPITLLAHIERSFFMGRLQTRLRIVDIL